MGRGFINFDADRVASGLKRLVDAGIGTDVGGVPSFDNESIARFLASTGQQSPGTIPTSPLNQAPSDALVDESVKFSRDLNGLQQIDSRLAELAIQKNNVAAGNLEAINMDIEVSSAKQALADATSSSMFNFDPTQDDDLRKKQQVAQAQLNLATKNAEIRIQRQTSLDVVPLDNEIIKLTQQRASLDALIRKEERDESTLPIAVQQGVTSFEGLTDPADIDKTWDIYTKEKKELVTESAGLAKNESFEWADAIIDEDRAGYSDFLRSRLKPGPETDSFNSLEPQMNAQLAGARKAAAETLKEGLRLGRESAKVGDLDHPLAGDLLAQKAWVDNEAAVIMRENTTSAWDVYVTGSSWESITRDGFSSDQTWQVAQTMQANIDPAQPDIATAITEVMDRMPPMEIDFRNQVIREYIRKQQSLFNKPRDPFGMGIDQGTIDVLSDFVSTRMISVDKVRARESILRDDVAGLSRRGRGGVQDRGRQEADIASADFSQIGRGGVFSRARTNSIARATQTALDAALRAANPPTPLPRRFSRGQARPGAPAETGPASAADLRTAVDALMAINPGLSVEEATSMAMNPNVNAGGQQPIAGFTEQDLENLSDEEAGLLDQLLKKVKKFQRDRDKPTAAELRRQNENQRGVLLRG